MDGGVSVACMDTHNIINNNNNSISTFKVIFHFYFWMLYLLYIHETGEVLRRSSCDVTVTDNTQLAREISVTQK